MAKELAISLPFKIDSYGKIGSTNDVRKIWADRVRSVIGTAVYERVMRPGFGTKIPYEVFGAQELAEPVIEREVQNAFEKQLPSLTYKSTEFDFDEFTGQLNIEVTYELPSESETASTLVGVAYINNNNPLYEEML